MQSNTSYHVVWCGFMEYHVVHVAAFQLQGMFDFLFYHDSPENIYYRWRTNNFGQVAGGTQWMWGFHRFQTFSFPEGRLPLHSATTSRCEDLNIRYFSVWGRSFHSSKKGGGKKYGITHHISALGPWAFLQPGMAHPNFPCLRGWPMVETAIMWSIRLTTSHHKLSVLTETDFADLARVWHLIWKYLKWFE